MTITEPIDSGKTSDNLMCPGCGTLLPSHANFCGACGERIIKKKNEEWEAQPENGDHDGQEQEVDDTAPKPALSPTDVHRLQSYPPLKNNGRTGQTDKSSSRPLDREGLPTDELTATSIPLADIETKNHTVTKTTKASTINLGRQAMQRSWLLARSLVERFRNDSLVRNSIYIMATTVITGAIGYLYWIVVAHIYSTHDVGLASALLSVLGLTSTLASLGIGSTLIQMLPRREAGYAWSLTLNAGLAIATLSGLLAGAIAVLVLPLFSQKFAIVWHDAAYALVFIVSVPLSIIVTLMDQVFVAERAASNMLVRNVADSVIKLLLMVLLAGAGVLGLFSAPNLTLVATLIGASLLLVPRLGRRYCLAVRGITEQVRNMLSSLAGNHFINLGSVLPAYLMPVFVTVRLSAEDNAYYSISGMLTSFFFIVSPAVASALFAEGSHRPQDVLRKARTSAGIISILLAPAMLVSFLGGHYILLLFGPSYAQHGLMILMIFTISAVPDAITNIYVSVLRVQGRLRNAVLLNLGMAGLNLVLAWMLLPLLGTAGPPTAFLTAQVAGSLVAGVDFIRIRRQRRGSVSQGDSGSAEMQNSYQSIEELL